MQVRRAVRHAISALHGGEISPLVLVGLSGGADSLALAAGLAAEASTAGIRAGAIVVDHGLQPGSSDIAASAADQARTLGLDPVVVRRVAVREGGGPEAAAREARYAAFAAVAMELSPVAIMTAHTRDDQAEQVLLALARGSGTRSIAGIPPVRHLSETCVLVRPFLGADPAIVRATTVAACAELGLAAWNDPHNADPGYARVRVRERVLPVLTDELGVGIRAGLARSADLAREDAEALDTWAARAVRELGEITADGAGTTDAIVIGSAGIARLAELPAAVRQRVLHRIAAESFGVNLSREHTLALALLVTDWRGRGPAFVPGIRATRLRHELRLVGQVGSPRGVDVASSES